MTQYTIEHFERQRELLGQTPTSLYESQDIYVHVDEDTPRDLDDLHSTCHRLGVTVRESTPEEVKHVWDLEVELEYHEPDVARHWPEEMAEIILQIKDW